MPCRLASALCCLLAPALADEVRVAGLGEPVEILRDRWGVPHIYAKNSQDLFFAQGYMTARDRLWQIDLWRRVGAGRLAEILGEAAAPRDRLARLIAFRGDWNAEWAGYSDDALEIVRAFTAGINAYIQGLGGARPLEFRVAGYDPGLWRPEDVVSRVAGLLMVRNVSREVARAVDIRRFGIETVQRLMPPDPFIEIRVPHGLDLNDITSSILDEYRLATGGVRFTEQQGSNNWVVDGSLSSTGKPLLASDPHRPVQIPSLRKTWHLVAPGWNVFGAGEPALPGVALGHNEHIGFGFTIVGIDQADLYVEKLNPENPDEYLHRGRWRKVEVVRDQLRVRGRAAPLPIELRYTLHGPIIHEDRVRRRAYALRWVGAEPGGAGYLGALRLLRARNWNEFQRAMENYRIPSENMVYADREGNIGWIAAGWVPLRPNWSGLLPVPGDSGEYEWSGYLPGRENPRRFNPAEHYIATANHNILPPGYPHVLSYEWSAPFRFARVDEMLRAGKKFTIADFERMQYDVTSFAARRFLEVLRGWRPPPGSLDASVRDRLLRWDARLEVDSVEATLFAVWTSRLPAALYGPELGARVSLVQALRDLEAERNHEALGRSLRDTLAELETRFGANMEQWRWGTAHQLHLRHPLGRADWDRGPLPRPGNADTVNAAGGSLYRQTSGASYRHILDLADWDRSVMTNTPGESGDPESPYYANLLDDWAAGRYHPMPFSRKAVEAAAAERIVLVPPR